MATVLPVESPRAEHEPERQLLGQRGGEAFFSSLKKERIKKRIYPSRVEALADIADYIETFCNRTRRHSHLAGVSPEQFEVTHRRARRRARA
jgi:putative transposase